MAVLVSCPALRETRQSDGRAYPPAAQQDRWWISVALSATLHAGLFLLVCVLPARPTPEEPVRDTTPREPLALTISAPLHNPNSEVVDSAPVTSEALQNLLPEYQPELAPAGVPDLARPSHQAEPARNSMPPAGPTDLPPGARVATLGADLPLASDLIGVGLEASGGSTVAQLLRPGLGGGGNGVVSDGGLIGYGAGDGAGGSGGGGTGNGLDQAIARRAAKPSPPQPAVKLKGLPAYPRACRQGLCNHGVPCEGDSEWRVHVPAAGGKPEKIECIKAMSCELLNASIRTFFGNQRFPATDRPTVYSFPVPMRIVRN